MPPIDPSEKPLKKPVWDLPTRLFHWTLVATVATAAITGFVGPDSWTGFHAQVGYVIISLLFFRVIWGVIGPRYSRFSSFMFSRSENIQYFRKLISGKPPHHTGHNPAGALMIFALLGSLLGLVITGLMVWGGEEKSGPLASMVPYRLGHAAEEVHEVLAITLLILIGLHVLGVLLESRLSGENLARSMVSGIKRIAPSSLPTGVTWYGSILGIFILSIAVTVSLFGLPAWSSILPAATLPASVSNTLYERECGDCHHGFHPSLLPEKTWTTVMDGLSNHFGEDATLSAETKEELSRYLVENSADHWDTKGANLFRPPAPDDPLRITATKRWRRIHRELAPEIFKNPKVGGKTNCAACHGDAATGMFADAKIKVPEKK